MRVPSQLDFVHLLTLSIITEILRGRPEYSTDLQQKIEENGPKEMKNVIDAASDESKRSSVFLSAVSYGSEPSSPSFFAKGRIVGEKSDSSSELPREIFSDRRTTYLTNKQRVIYDDMIRNPELHALAIESLLSIAARGNLRPRKNEIAAFLIISKYQRTEEQKWAHVDEKRYRCSLCSYSEMDRWDMAEYHIHEHLDLKTHPCEVPQW